jgi:glycosyltransferase involved in cell wall biosynthesis
MPKILRIINRLNIGGPTFNVAYLTKYLSSRYETLLVSGTIDDGEASSEYILEELGIKPVYIPEMQRPIRPFKDRKAYSTIKQIIKKFQPDIVHTHAAKAGTLGRLAAYHSNVPVILHTFHGHVFHSYFHPLVTKAFIQIERYLAKKSSKIVAISELQKKELSQDFKICQEEKIVVVPNGFDLDRFQKDYDLKRNRFRTQYSIPEQVLAIGIIGRLAPIKNHELFLKSIDLLRKISNIPFMAFIIGDGELRVKLEGICQQLNLPFAKLDQGEVPQLVNFTSWIKEIDIANAGLDIIALTSLNEGTPVSLVEAQAAGNPIVTTNVGGVADVVIHEKAGFLTPSNQHEPFANALKILLENENLRKSMGDFGHSFAFEKFGYQRLVKDMENLYDQLLHKD